MASGGLSCSVGSGSRFYGRFRRLSAVGRWAIEQVVVEAAFGFQGLEVFSGLLPSSGFAESFKRIETLCLAPISH